VTTAPRTEFDAPENCKFKTVFALFRNPSTVLLTIATLFPNSFGCRIAEKRKVTRLERGVWDSARHGEHPLDLREFEMTHSLPLKRLRADDADGPPQAVATPKAKAATSSCESVDE